MTDASPPWASRAVLNRWTVLCLAAALCSGTASAQTLRPTTQFHSLASALGTAQEVRDLDFVVALVNGEPVTNAEVRRRLLRLEQQLSQDGVALPNRDVLLKDVLEQLVLELAQVQHATETGVRVDDAMVQQAEQSIAEQNQLSLAEFRSRVVQEGIDLSNLRRDLRHQILIQRLREREMQRQVGVTEDEIDAYIREKQASADPAQMAWNLAQVLVQVPENATDEQVRTLEARAQAVAQRARNGHDFAALAQEFSDAPDRTQGGEFGLRPADRLPSLFVEAVRSLPQGGIAGPLRSGAGFHVLKVLEKSQQGLPDMSVVQTRARHILLRTSAQLTQAAAVAQLNQLREQILRGQASFPALAREHSQDGSASQGGDLGWANPGQFVPEFETAMNALRAGETSAPVVSRFGVHLIRVDERRTHTLSEREQRDAVRTLVREQKAEAAWTATLDNIRSQAFVEYRNSPQP
ncbi:MAG: hypothetical protein RLZZ352_2452 [Pseudomonadota bacterium]